MNKKTVVIISTITVVITVAAVGLAAFLTSGFTFGKISKEVYNIQNVYDEIWNLVNSEGHGNSTVLTKAISDAEAIFELGVLDYIRIPECKATLSNRSGTLWISICTGEYFFEETTGRKSEKYVVYEYDCHTKALSISGSEDEAYMIDRFLTKYFEWKKASNSQSDYSLDNLGNYSVTLVDLGDYILSSPVAE